MYQSSKHIDMHGNEKNEGKENCQEGPKSKTKQRFSGQRHGEQSSGVENRRCSDERPEKEGPTSEHRENKTVEKSNEKKC